MKEEKIESGIILIKDKKRDETVVSELFQNKEEGNMLWKSWVDSTIYRHSEKRGSMNDIVIERYNIANIDKICGKKTDKQIGFILRAVQPDEQLDVVKAAFAKKNGYEGYDVRGIEVIVRKQRKEYSSYASRKGLVSLLTTEKDRTTKEGEFCHAKRIFDFKGYLSYTGADTIRDHKDVAYIMRQLETKAVENTFVVLVKGGKAVAFHVGIGDSTCCMLDAKAILAAEKKINADQIYFIHNHPSGNLLASVDDVNLYEKMKATFGDKVQDGIIINTISGKYGTFNSDEKNMIHDYTEYQDDGVEIPVFAFDKAVFSEKYIADDDLNIIRSSKDVAQFISGHRLGERNKMSCLVRNMKGQCVANIALGYNSIAGCDMEKLVDNIIENVIDVDGDIIMLSAIIDEEKLGCNKKKVEELCEMIAKKTMGRIKLLDVIFNFRGDSEEKIKDRYFSCIDEGAMSFSNNTQTTVREEEIKYEAIDFINMAGGGMAIRCKINGEYRPAEKLSSFECKMINKGLMTKEDVADKYFGAEVREEEKNGLCR